MGGSNGSPNSSIPTHPNLMQASVLLAQPAPLPNQPEAAALETAKRAYAAYAKSLETGDSRDLARLVTDQVAFMVTIPEAGRKGRRGKKELALLVDWRWNQQKLRPVLTLDGITHNGQTAGFEYRVAGELGEKPYRNHVAVFFDVAGGRVTAFREYYGDNKMSAEAFRPLGLEPVLREKEAGTGEATQGKPPTLSTTELVTPAAGIVEVGKQAFEAFALSVEKGDWQPFLDLMDPDVTFTLPIPGRWRGQRQGIPEVAEYHRWRWEDLKMRTPVFLTGMTSNAHTVAVEFRIDGTIADSLRVKHPAVYFMDVLGGKVVGFREYNGDEEDIPK